MDGIRIVIIGVLWIVFMLSGKPGSIDTSSVYYILVHPFLHVNLWHLLVNSIAVWSVFTPGRKHNGRDLVLGIVLGWASTLFATRAMLGFSNAIYAVIGIRTPSLKSRWWVKPQTILFLAITIGLIFISAFSAATHIASFVMGMAVSGFIRFIDEIRHDSGGAI